MTEPLIVQPQHIVITKKGASYWSTATDLGHDPSIDDSFMQALGNANGWADLHQGQIIYLPIVDPLPTPVYEPPAGLLFGASYPKDGTEAEMRAGILEFGELTGQGVPDVMRRFSGGMVTDFMSYGPFSSTKDLCHRVISVKSGLNPSHVATRSAFNEFADRVHEQLVALIESVPDDGFHTWVIINHEPENDDLKNGHQVNDQNTVMTRENYWAIQDELKAAITAVGRPDVVGAQCLMERHDSPLWIHPEPGDLALFVDAYDALWRKQQPLKMSYLVRALRDRWAEVGGRDFGVTECGTWQRDGAWWTDTFEFMYSIDARLLIPFHINLGDRMPPDGWRIDTDPRMVEAIRSALADA